MINVTKWLCKLGVHRDCKPEEEGIVCQYCGELIIESDGSWLLKSD